MNYFDNLSDEERYILKEKGTEDPFSGEYNDHFDAGVFVCRACGNLLYESNTKFNSGCGWPSFDDEIPGAIIKYKDTSLDRVRTEICCAKCDGHLGHVFHGENITEKNTRHCVNSLSIKFKKYDTLSQACFGGGGFWNLQYNFSIIKGVYMTQSGYMGGHIHNPTYNDVSNGESGHAEVVQIYYDENIITYLDLLESFLKIYYSTDRNNERMLFDQYRPIIFVYSNQQHAEAKRLLKNKHQLKSKCVLDIKTAKEFHRAEEFHQHYLRKNNMI